MADRLWGGGDEVVVEAYGTADAIGALSGRTTNIVTFETTIAGNAADFDEEEFRERLAAVLGVDPSSIVLEVNGTNPFTVTSSLATVGALQTRSVTQALAAVQAGGMAAEVLGVAVTAIGAPMVTMGVSGLPAHLAVPTSPAATPVVSFSATIAGDRANFDEAAYRAAVAAALGISPSEVQLEISGTDPFTVVAKIAASSAEAAASLSAAVASTLADPEMASAALGVSVASISKPATFTPSPKRRPRTSQSILEHLFATVDEAMIIEAFSHVDEDGSGCLDMAELGKALQELDGSITDAEVPGIFALCDPSGDGKVSVLEFLRAKRGDKAPPRRPDTSLPLEPDAEAEAKLALENKASRIAAARLESSRRREQTLLEQKAHSEAARKQATSKLELEAVAEAARVEALLAAQEARDKERRAAAVAEMRRLEAEREAFRVASLSAREAREKESDVAREEQARKIKEQVAVEQEARRAEEEAKRAAEEERQAAQVRRLAEAAEEAKRLQEARREVALAEGQERQAALQSHLTELAEAQRNLRIQAEAAVQEEYVASVSAREARDKEAEVVREEQTRKVAEGIAAEQEARRVEEEGKRKAEETAEAALVQKRAEHATVALKEQEEKRSKLVTERLALDVKRAEEAAALQPKWSERTLSRKERQRKLEGRHGCVGILAVLREVYADKELACSEAVFVAVMAYVGSRRLRHVTEILKFRKVDELLEVLPGLDKEEAAGKLREALEKHAGAKERSQSRQGYGQLGGIAEEGAAGFPGSPPKKKAKKKANRDAAAES